MRCGIYLSYFSGRLRELCKPSNTDTSRQEQTAMPHLEWGITNVSVRRGEGGRKREKKKWLVMVHVRAASAAEQGQKAVESV